MSSASSTVKLGYETRAAHRTGLLQGSNAETYEKCYEYNLRAIQV